MDNLDTLPMVPEEVEFGFDIAKLASPPQDKSHVFAVPEKVDKAYQVILFFYYIYTSNAFHGQVFMPYTYV